jgi:hypothetical protein
VSGPWRGVIAQDGSQAVAGSGVRLPKWLMIARSPGCGFVLGKMSVSGYASVGGHSSIPCENALSGRILDRDAS